MSIVRNDKIYDYLKADGTRVWFRFDKDDNGAYQFLFQTGTAAGDKTAIAAQAAFTNITGYPGATSNEGSVFDSVLIAFADGTAALPSITFTNDLDCGLYRIGANNIGLSLNGVLAVDFATTGVTIAGDLTVTGGNMGVGTVVPTAACIGTAGDVTSGVTQYGILIDNTLSGTTESNGFAVGGTAKAATAITTWNGFHVTPIGIGAGATIVTIAGLKVDNVGTAGITNAYGIDIAAQSGAATVNMGLRNAGTTQLTGLVGIGVAPNAGSCLIINAATGLTGVSQSAINASVTFTSAATTDGTALYGKITTAAAAYVMGNSYGVLIDTPTIGAASAITTSYGLRVANQGAAGITNAYGIDIAAQSGAATINRGLRNAGNTELNGTVGIGTVPDPSIGLDMNYGSLTGVSQHGILSRSTLSSAATTAGYAGSFTLITAADAFTMVSGFGVYVGTPTIGAASAVTTNVGVNVANQGAAGITNAYGIDIAAQSGAVTVNMGLRNAGTTQLTGLVGIGVAPDAASCLLVNAATGLAGVSQNAINSAVTFTSAATTSGTALQASVTTAAAAFVMVSGYGVRVIEPVIGAASAITTQYGIRVENQGVAGVTNAYGVDIAAQSGAATINMGLRNAGTTYLTSSVGVGVAPDVAYGILVNAVAGLAGVAQYGVASDITFTSAATTSGTCLYAKTRTAAAIFTMVSGYGLYVDTPVIGAGPGAITTQYGAYFTNQGAANITNAYGIYVAAQSGAATLNIAAHLAGLVQIGGVGLAVGSLPGAAAAYQGMRTFVTDSNTAFTAGIGAVVAAGGANIVPVWCDGTNWRIG